MSAAAAAVNDGVGPDFDLPDEILAVIPTDPYDQLDLARKITSIAIASRVSVLESETNRLKEKVEEQDSVIFELKENSSRVQTLYEESESRLKIMSDENLNLVQERDSLAAAVKKLTRELGKLETFKRQLMQSLNEDTSTEVVDIRTIDQSVPKAYPDKDDATNGSTEARHVTDEATTQPAQTYSITPYETSPRLTPTGTPKMVSASVSPKSNSAVGSPHKTSGSTTPTNSIDRRASMSSWYPSSQQSSAANSPPCVRAMPSRTPRIDGKEFFRLARNRLSYEQFSAFLANIKELNAQKQSREETLRKAEDIFGTDNKDLYISFQALINRNAH